VISESIDLIGLEDKIKESHKCELGNSKEKTKNTDNFSNPTSGNYQKRGRENNKEKNILVSTGCHSRIGNTG
jgi:hypothetical protein